jgi:hypothetical protein
MKDFPPRIKKRIREYSMQAHENELKIALAELAPKFKAWEAGQMGSGELSDIVYRWANGINMEKMYTRAAEFVTKHDLKDQFQSRVEQIVSETSGIGWGFHDYLTEVYCEHFGDF